MTKRSNPQSRLPARSSAAAFLFAAASSAASAADTHVWVAPDRWFVYGLVIVVLAGSVLCLWLIRAALIVSPWSFSDALSEPTEVTAVEPDAQGVPRTKLDAAGEPLKVTEMRASSSRVIALMGTLVILLMFLGFGSIALYSFASTGTLPDSIDKVVNFMLAGLTLFAPYAVNQFSNIFEQLARRKS